MPDPREMEYGFHHRWDEVEADVLRRTGEVAFAAVRDPRPVQVICKHNLHWFDIKFYF